MMEKKGFRTKYYYIESPKTVDGHIRIAFLSDLHDSVFGPGNQDLYQEIVDYDPDLVLIGGDMVIRWQMQTYVSAHLFIRRLARRFPVYLTRGNHEQSLRSWYDETFRDYEKCLYKAGVHFLSNKDETIQIRGKKLHLYGLELPLIFYKKPRSPIPTVHLIESKIGKPDPEAFNILLAHSPRFGKEYFAWGSDLTLSGHYHGGVIRLGENLGVVSPYFHLFPKYNSGLFLKKEQTMLVSGGLGEHTVRLRINNPRELLLVELN